MNNLIIVPVGSPINKFLNQYHLEEKDHWRWTNSGPRNYEILAVQYGEFEPEKNTYDKLVKMSGFKWPIVKKLMGEIDYTKYEYIGFYDDDVILSRESMNRSFEIALEGNIDAFQISLAPGSESSYPNTRYNEGIKYSLTNFIEIMAPVFSSRILPKFLKLLDSYDGNYGWGLDWVLSEYLEIYPAVIHDVQMFHPARPETGSSYNKQIAFKEFYKLLEETYPALMSKEGRSIKKDYNNFKDLTNFLVMNS